jgi:hypothetical protein
MSGDDEDQYAGFGVESACTSSDRDAKRRNVCRFSRDENASLFGSRPLLAAEANTQHNNTLSLVPPSSNLKLLLVTYKCKILES